MWLLVGPGLRWIFPDRKRRMAMTGREVGEAGRRSIAWLRKYGTGRVLRCANCVEAVGTDMVEKLAIGLHGRRKKRMEASRRMEE